ncbi:MAG: MSMEG_0568 family radical SAM protein [Candidatus Jordarchaeales archaeon]
MHPTRLKVEVLCRGLRVEGEVGGVRKVGAGPAGGRHILLERDVVVNAPVSAYFAKKSSLVLRKEGGKWFIFDGGKRVSEVEFVPVPEFYYKVTSSGIPMWKIALLHGKDCVATTLLQVCERQSVGLGCKFCGISLSLKSGLTVARKRAEDLVEVVGAAVEEGVCRHVTITTGTPASPDRGARLLAEAARALKGSYDVPVHVQLEPPRGGGAFEVLVNAGVDTVGVHVETFDENVRRKVCPGKSEVSLQEYFDAWRRAVDAFGEAQVSTYVIVGLGESDDCLLWGFEEAARIGVVPFLVPLIPIVGTEMEWAAPPPPDRMLRLYAALRRILLDYGVNPLDNKAGCVRCSSCSALREAIVWGV